MTRTRIVLGGMSAILSDSLGDLIDAQEDMQVVARTGDLLEAMRFVRQDRADFVIMQGAEFAPQLASLLAMRSLELLLIDRDGHAGALTRICATSRRLEALSGDRLLAAVRSVTTGSGL